MMRDLYHYETLSARMINERIADAAMDHLCPPSPVSRSVAHWVGLCLIRFGRYLLRYAIKPQSAYQHHPPWG